MRTGPYIALAAAFTASAANAAETIANHASGAAGLSAPPSSAGVLDLTGAAQASVVSSAPTALPLMLAALAGLIYLRRRPR